VGIPEGVTLTIEPGATVYLNDAYLLVNGTLRAQGTSTNKISLICNGTSLGFWSGSIPTIQFRATNTSTSWNEQTNTGSIIENAIISSTQDSHTISIINTSPKINNNTIINTGGQRAIWIEGTAAPIISKNSITSIFAGITISNSFSYRSEYPQIIDNIISGCDVGIEVYSGSPIIEHNLIINNNGNKMSGNGGIRVDGEATPVIRNNTIVKNSIAINILGSPSPKIEFNNIYDNNEYSIYLYSGSKSNVNAAYNWWGTTDASEINQTIYDFKRDFNLGIVTFVPFLTVLNPEAPIAVSIPTTTPTPTPTPAPSPIPVPGQSFFFVESDSTISELFFNSTSSELSFTVSGESGTAGYVKITIAKSLLSSVQNVKVYFDGSQLNVAITEDADSWLLSFTYMHSTHQVRISLATNAAGATFFSIEYWILIAVVIVIAVAGIVGLIVWRKKKKP